MQKVELNHIAGATFVLLNAPKVHLQLFPQPLTQESFLQSLNQAIQPKFSQWIRVALPYEIPIRFKISDERHSEDRGSHAHSAIVPSLTKQCLSYFSLTCIPG